MTKAKRLPHTLKLLPGLRWTGSLTILGRHERGFVVGFNAEGIDSGEKQYIYDRAVLTPQQLKDWTGWSEGDETAKGATNPQGGRQK
jgi:hypothetical protein